MSECDLGLPSHFSAVQTIDGPYVQIGVYCIRACHFRSANCCHVERPYSPIISALIDQFVQNALNFLMKDQSLIVPNKFRFNIRLSLQIIGIFLPESKSK